MSRIKALCWPCVFAKHYFVLLPYNYTARYDVRHTERTNARIAFANRGIPAKHPITVDNSKQLAPGIRSDNGITVAEGELPLHSNNPPAFLDGRRLLSNRGIPLDLSRLNQLRVNTSAVERRAQSHVARRTVKKDWQAAWLLRAITCMDLTTLSGDDTDDRVRRLCAKAMRPIQHDMVKRLAIEPLNIHVAAVCVYHRFVETARRALEGSAVRVAAVSTGFPQGSLPSPNVLLKFAVQSRRVLTKLMSSSRELWFSADDGRNYTMRLPPSNTRVARPT